MKITAFSKGEAIYDQAHYQRCMGIVQSGTVEVYGTEGEHPVLLNVLTAGQTFGVATLFYDAGFYISRIDAKTRCEVLFIPQQALRSLFSQSMQAVENYIAFLSGRIYFLSRKIDAFTKGGAEQRLAMYLADQAQNTGEGFTVTVAIRHEQGWRHCCPSAARRCTGRSRRFAKKASSVARDGS